MVEYNKRYKEWKGGDVFAYKIKDNEEYKGRYLILIVYENEEWTKPNNWCYFRVKITQDEVLTKTKEEIESLEYMRNRYTLYCDRFFPFIGGIPNKELAKARSKTKFYPDKYGFLYTYIFSIWFERKRKNILEDFVYLGNFKVLPPKGEYIPFAEANTNLYTLAEFEEQLILNYKRYNLKQDTVYTLPVSPCRFGTNILPELEEIEYEREPLIKRDRITYVGGGVDPDKIKRKK